MEGVRSSYYEYCVVNSPHVQALRLEFIGALYHVTSRGDRREEIYDTDQDRESFLAILGEVCERYNWVCHAYCLVSQIIPRRRLTSSFRYKRSIVLYRLFLYTTKCR